jgi:hypothetical protein
MLGFVAGYFDFRYNPGVVASHGGNDERRLKGRKYDLADSFIWHRDRNRKGNS